MRKKRELPIYNEIRCEIAAGLARNGMNSVELAKLTGIPYGTLRMRLNTKHPENIRHLTLGELVAIREVLGNA